MIGVRPRTTQRKSSAASNVYKKQIRRLRATYKLISRLRDTYKLIRRLRATYKLIRRPVSYSHLRNHETKVKFVCRLLLEKKHFLLPFTHPTLSP